MRNLLALRFICLICKLNARSPRERQLAYKANKLAFWDYNSFGPLPTILSYTGCNPTTIARRNGHKVAQYVRMLKRNDFSHSGNNIVCCYYLLSTLE